MARRGLACRGHERRSTGAGSSASGWQDWDRALPDVLHRRRADPVRPRDGVAALLRVRGGHRGVHRHGEGGFQLCDGVLGHGDCALDQPVRRDHSAAGAAAAGPRRRHGRPSGSARRPSANAPTSPRSRSSTSMPPRSTSARASLAYEQAMADLAAKYPDDREASIFWALSLAISALPTDKTYANQLKAGAILEKLYPGAAGSSRHHALHHSQLRRAGAGRQGDRGRAPLRGDRAGRAARAAHAVAHVHARRRLAGIDRHEHRVRRSRAKRQRERRAAARDGLHGLRVSADGAGPRGRRRCSRRCPASPRRSIPTR